jgi:hypothetical protein
VTTARVIHDQISNILDYLTDAKLALYANPVSMDDTSVSWHSQNPAAPFLITHAHPSVDQYMAWVSAGAYSAALFEGSLLQLAYQLEGSEVVGHRLAYIPCPYDVDTELLAEGMPIADVVDLYRGSESAMRSPLRFEFDLRSATSAHPAAHLTINTTDCRIACVAPVHALRFVDFVFRHFYSALWEVHQDFFRAAAWQHIGPVILGADDRDAVHLMWNVHARAG